MDETRLRFLFAARQRVLDQLLSGWRRRGSSLLHIGLNGGLSPESFWEAGFDVTALDRSPERLSSLREQTGPKVEFACGSPELLPYGDGEFDYAVLVHHGLKSRRGTGIGAGLSGDRTPPELSEALRVASRGVIVLEWNRFSLAGVPGYAGKNGESGIAERGVLPWELWGMLGRVCPERRRHLVSALPLWQCTWPCAEGGRWRTILHRMLTPFNITPAALPFGAVLGVRVDWNSVPLTPAGVLRSAAEKLCPVKPREELIGRKAAHASVPVEPSPRQRKES